MLDLHDGVTLIAITKLYLWSNYLLPNQISWVGTCLESILSQNYIKTFIIPCVTEGYRLQLVRPSVRLSVTLSLYAPYLLNHWADAITIWHQKRTNIGGVQRGVWFWFFFKFSTSKVPLLDSYELVCNITKETVYALDPRFWQK